MGRGEYAVAQQCLEESLAISRATEAKANEALDLGWLGKLHHLRGEYDDACACYEVALAKAGEARAAAGRCSSVLEAVLGSDMLADAETPVPYFERSLTLLEDEGPYDHIVASGSVGGPFCWRHRASSSAQVLSPSRAL
jgi:tetratricopeptide (TPR) repeat protein